MTPIGYDPPIMQHDNPIGVADGFKTMSNDNYRSICLQLCGCRSDLDFRSNVN